MLIVEKRDAFRFAMYVQSVDTIRFNICVIPFCFEAHSQYLAHSKHQRVASSLKVFLRHELV